MNIQPLHDKILVRPFDPEQVTEGGIIIPVTAQERPSVAIVLAVGNGLENRPMTLEVGDIVYHIKQAGTPVAVDGEVLYFLRDVDCHGYERKEKK